MAERFCTQCGATLPEAARFCTQCGTARRAAASSAKARPIPAGSAEPPLRRYAPLIILGAILVAFGVVVVVGALQPREAPRIVARQGTPAPGTQAMPADHPPLEIPAQVKAAIAELQSKAEENSEDLPGWTHLAEVLYRAAQIDQSYLDQAGDAYDRILAIDPDHTEGLRGRGSVAYEKNQPKEAIRHFERYLELVPDDLGVQTDLGTMFLADGQVERAVRSYDTVLKSDPNFFQALFNLAIAYRTAGQDEASLAMLERARDQAPDDATRQQIEQVIQRAGQPADGTAAAAAVADAAGNFRSAIETMVRTHQILASKVQRFDWQDDHNLRLVLTGFPMEQMPDSMRELFISRMKERIAQAKSSNRVTEPVTIELVDFDSGHLMDTLVE